MAYKYCYRDLMGILPCDARKTWRLVARYQRSMYIRNIRIIWFV